MDLFTIGFTKKTAKEFFTTLEGHGVRRVIDVRLNNKSQLAGFTKEYDLRFFLDRVSGIEYEWWPFCAPPEYLLKRYQDGEIDWSGYMPIFVDMLEKRNVIGTINKRKLERACLLCSEPTADRCHRRLLAEYFQERIDDLTITHL